MMMHDSRRYHRIRPPTCARGYGILPALASAAGEAGSAIGSAGSAIGSGLESAAGAVGSGLGTAATAAAPTLGKIASTALGGAGQSALGGLESVGHGLSSLFGPSEAGRLAALGQAVPQGVELVGPSSTFTGPGFLPSVMQGFMGTMQKLAEPSAGTSLGHGVGQILSTLDQLNAQRQGGMSIQPIVQGLTGQAQRPRVIPDTTPPGGPGPIMSLFKPIMGL